MIAARRSTFQAGGIAAMLLAAFVLAGCGSSPVPAQTPPASGKPAGASVRIAAQGIAFDATQLGVPANQPFTIVFDNREAVPHNISIERRDGGRDRLFEGAVFGGPATRWYTVPALAPGEYTFLCQVHPSMTGQLVAA